MSSRTTKKLKRSTKNTGPKHQPTELLIQPIHLDTGLSSAAGDVARKAREAFEQLGAMVSDSSAAFSKAIWESELNNPSEIELGFEVGLEATGNWIVVAGKGTATATIKLKWSNASRTGS